MKTSQLKRFLILAPILFLTFAACGKSETEKLAGAETAQTANYQKKDTYFSLRGIRAEKIDLADYANKPVMLLFFAEYCPYCQKAAPFVKKISEAYKDKGFSVIGIGVDDKTSARKYAEENFLDFAIAYSGGEIARKYKTRGVPYIYVLGKDHEIINFWAGYDPSFDKEIKDAIEQALAQS